MTYTTNTRPAVHRGDVITIKDGASGYRETITVGTAAIIDDHGHVTLHVHQAETGDIYEIDDRKEGWTLEHVECPHPKAMRFPDDHPAARCLRCAWADWLAFPDVETPAPPTPPAYRTGGDDHA